METAATGRRRKQKEKKRLAKAKLSSASAGISARVGAVGPSASVKPLSSVAAGTVLRAGTTLSKHAKPAAKRALAGADIAVTTATVSTTGDVSAVTPKASGAECQAVAKRHKTSPTGAAVSTAPPQVVDVKLSKAAPATATVSATVAAVTVRINTLHDKKTCAA